MEVKDVKFEFKQLTDDGSFEGLLATYGNIDLGNDLIEPGAFNKTINDNGGQVPMLWAHQPTEPVGLLHLRDTPEGLAVNGTLDLNVQRAREAHSLMRNKIVKGLSIGFTSIKDSIQNGVRHLKEIRLWEGSLVTFPMNRLAVIQAVKSVEQQEEDTLDEIATLLIQQAQMLRSWPGRR